MCGGEGQIPKHQNLRRGGEEEQSARGTENVGKLY